MDIVEGVISFYTLAKWAGGFLVATLMGIIGWNVNTAKNDIDTNRRDLDDVRKCLSKHEIEAAEKIGSLQASIKMLMETVPRIHERIDDIHNYLVNNKK